MGSFILQMNQLQTELRLALSLIAERDSEIQRVRTTNNQVSPRDATDIFNLKFSFLLYFILCYFMMYIIYYASCISKRC